MLGRKTRRDWGRHCKTGALPWDSLFRQSAAGRSELSPPWVSIRAPSWALARLLADLRVELFVLLGAQSAVQAEPQYLAREALRHLLSLLRRACMGPGPDRPQEGSGDHQHRGHLRIDTRLGKVRLHKAFEVRNILPPEGILGRPSRGQQLEQPYAADFRVFHRELDQVLGHPFNADVLDRLIAR